MTTPTPNLDLVLQRLSKQNSSEYLVEEDYNSCDEEEFESSSHSDKEMDCDEDEESSSSQSESSAAPPTIASLDRFKYTKRGLEEKLEGDYSEYTTKENHLYEFTENANFDELISFFDASDRREAHGGKYTREAFLSDMLVLACNEFRKKKELTYDIYNPFGETGPAKGFEQLYYEAEVRRHTSFHYPFHLVRERRECFDIEYCLIDKHETLPNTYIVSLDFLVNWQILLPPHMLPLLDDDKLPLESRGNNGWFSVDVGDILLDCDTTPDKGNKQLIELDSAFLGIPE